MRFTAPSHIFAVILVGGKGKRLRPLSSDARPKAFLSVTRDRKTIFRKTLERIAKVILSENILVVANRRHKKLVKKDFPGLDEKNLILESVSRNTAPAIAMAASRLKDRSKNAVMVVLPTDHYISGEERFSDSVRSAVDFVEKAGDVLLVMAVKPRYPATRFGYVRLKTQDSRLKTGNIYKVEEFVEKPDLKTAKRFLSDKRYLWNVGSFVFKASSISKAIDRFAPSIRIGKDYKKMPNISIDYAVMEKADNIYCVKGSYEWDDVGNFESLKQILKQEGRGFIERGGRIAKII